MRSLDFIADYYGEKFAFYLAWLIHYTHWLMYPAAVGLILFIIQIAHWLSSDVTFFDATDSALNPLYSIFIALWSTFFVESWKRKEAYLANRWDVRDFR